MDSYDPRRKSRAANHARERQEARRRRQAERTQMAVKRDAPTPKTSQHIDSGPPSPRDLAAAATARARLLLHDGLWYARHNPRTWLWSGAALAALFTLYLLGSLLSGRVFPNTYALGVNLGGLNTEQAAQRLDTALTDDLRIALIVEGSVHTEVPPAALGLSVNTAQTAADARAAGLCGIPFGCDITPTVTMDYLTAERFFLDQAEKIATQPVNAAFTWQNGRVVGIPGTDGRDVNISTALTYLQDNAAQVLESRRLTLPTLPIPPDHRDPSALVAQAERVAAASLRFIGYDPFTDTTTTWATDPANVVTWLEAGEGKLRLRGDSFKQFIDALNDSIAASGDNERYVDLNEAKKRVEDAIANDQSDITLRMRYYPQVYTVQPGDRGFSIARKTGIPFYLIQEANAGSSLDILYVGEELNLPSRDKMIPETPIPHKRIVVDLDTQWMTAFENGVEVFSWGISSGRSDAPTSPGIYQILSHNDITTGSGFSLCADGQCGRWTMHWFMGIYEVRPGLLNGFHGAVELPDGTYLGGGGVSYPSTFGCVMAEDGNAKALYDWAEIGTMVEIISSEYPPQSELGRRVRDRSRST